MFRLFLYLFLILCSTLAYSFNFDEENLGIAFVHGTNDHRIDAETEYWKPNFTQFIADALDNPENKFVVHCDFSQYMWTEEAGGCLAEQLTQFIKEKKLTKLILYTHSNGGNVIRWILSNPTYDERHLLIAKTVHQVIAFAPSSGGTLLADDAIDGNKFEAGLGWLLGYNNDAVRQQRVADMAIYNDEVLFGTPGRPHLPVPFRTVIGSDVEASPVNSNNYCNGYLLNAALKITKTYLDSCADGYLNCSSQELAGNVWFYDWEKTAKGVPLNHNQSRHGCHGFEYILRQDLRAQGATQ